MEQAIEYIVGMSFTILGLSYVIRANAWVLWLKHVEGEHMRASLALGSMCLFMGTFILGFHWVWKGIPLITSVIGIVCTLKGFIYLIFPQWLSIKLKLLEKNFVPALRLAGIMMMLVGLIIIRDWSISSGIEHFKQFEQFFNIGNIE